MEDNNPILTIGIPTYNRSPHLNESLNHLCNEVGNDNRFEIVISNNNSTDNTDEVVNKYIKLYKNIVYFKQSENVGFDRNLKKVLDLSKGKYIKLLGDDDFLNTGAMNHILNIINANNDCDLFFIHLGMNNLDISKGFGYDNLLTSLRNSANITAITTLIINNDAYKRIENKEKYLDSEVYQVYIEMELIKNNPNFGLIGRVSVLQNSGRGGRRSLDLGKVGIANYFDILYDYKIYGLSEKTLKEEREHFLLKSMIPTILYEINLRKNNIIDLDLDSFEEIYIKYYSEEEYFKSRLDEIKGYLSILQELKNKIDLNK